MNPQDVGNMVWVLATINMPPMCSLREVPWAAAEHDTRHCTGKH
jgi:hypothetical protein